MTKYELNTETVLIQGRTLRIGGFLWLGFSASGIEFTTSAEHVAVEVCAIAENQPVSENAYLALILDHNLEGMRKIRTRRGTYTYEILRNPDRVPVTVSLIKLSEARNDKVGLGRLLADSPVVPAPAAHRKLLFIGDSLTAGYGIDGSDFDGKVLHRPEEYQFSTGNENPLYAYPMAAARLLNARVQLVCWSGDGIISQWIDPPSDVPVTTDLLPAIYSYTDRTTENVVRIHLGSRGMRDENGAPLIRKDMERWDPARYVPDAIVLNAGTNDVSFTKGIPVRERHFTQNYAHFIERLKTDYPEAKILVVYGLMEQTLMDPAREAAVLSDVEFLPLPLMNPAVDGIGCGGHPSRKTHEKTGRLIAGKLADMLGEERTADTQD